MLIVKSIPQYKPYDGFYDLRKFNLPKKVFARLWEVQYMLSEMSRNAEYYKQWHPRQWQDAQEVSALYQQELFRYGSPFDN